MKRTKIIRYFLAGLLCGSAVLCAEDSPWALMDNGHFKRARGLAEQRYRANPNDPETLWAMSRVKQEWHDLAAALDFAEKAVASNPKEARYHLQLAEVAGDWAQRAGVVRQMSLGRRFKKELDAAVALDPKNIGALQDLVAYYFVAPGIMGGDKARARQIAAQIMQIDVEAGYIAQIQVARFEQQQHAPFEEIYRKMVAARPESYEGHMQLGSYLARRKRYDEAMEQAREALRIDPGRTSGHALAAATLAYQGKWGELDAALARAEKEVPDDPQPYFRAADVCLSTGVELPRAERYYRKYLAQEPEPDSPTPASAHWRLGQTLEKEGRKADAIAEWQTAVKLDPNSRAKEDLKRVK
jgi:tetratricopeptide (TPR) repeat protein